MPLSAHRLSHLQCHDQHKDALTAHSLLFLRRNENKKSSMYGTDLPESFSAKADLLYLMKEKDD